MKRYFPFESGTRRGFLEATGIVATIAGTSRVAAGTETTTEQEAASQETPTAAQEATPILLGGETSHWLGLAPEAIHEAENPTLTLQADSTYRLVWMNIDGREHELIIEDGDGNELVATESATQQGATRSVTFTASREMAQYYCEYHPQSMRGDVTLGTEGMTGTPTANGGNGSGC